MSRFKYLLIFFSCLLPLTTQASTELLPWKQQALKIEQKGSCYFTVVKKFNKHYYAFSGQQEDIDQDGKQFVPVVSDDGFNWKGLPKSFGKYGDTAITSSLVWKNSADETFFYIAAKNKETGVNVYRTADGTTWERVITDGLDSKNNDAINHMVAFKGKLYLFTENDVDDGANGARIFVSSSGAKNTWSVQKFSELMSSPGTVTAAKMIHSNPDGSRSKYIYLVTGAATMYRTTNGTDWQLLLFNTWTKGYGTKFINFNGYVYMAAFDDMSTPGTEHARLYRSKEPALYGWEELSLGVTTEQSITTFGKSKFKSESPELFFSTYPSSYMLRIKENSSSIDRVSDVHLGYSAGPNFVDSIKFIQNRLIVYSGTTYGYYVTN